MQVLILGGTAEARSLAAVLDERGVPVISSMAGRVSRPRMPAGEVRIGGFGGVTGLAEYVADERITHVVDATHPFATTMTANAVAAAEIAEVPFVRYARPGWSTHPLADTWTWVPSYPAAREAADTLGTRPFLTTGRQTLPHFRDPWADRSVLVRVVEPLTDPAPESWTVVHDRGPYERDGETALLRKHGIDVLLTKDSGGSYTAAKLDAAAELGVAVVVVSRPSLPTGATEVDSLAGVLTHLGAD
ncbi:cobalt-precorrin-6A reductase [Enemella sp. A6]|uniref:cobalt-precorrin-6A reductase n=1 Tax=Enemella sp. A6 TaxID=3440152 RepID=UPI003EBCB7C9